MGNCGMIGCHACRLLTSEIWYESIPKEMLESTVVKRLIKGWITCGFVLSAAMFILNHSHKNGCNSSIFLHKNPEKQLLL